jgi:hypothetical protein
VLNLGDYTAKDSTRQNEHFQHFELEIKIFKILKPLSILQKVPSYAVESLKHPLAACLFLSMKLTGFGCEIRDKGGSKLSSKFAPDLISHHSILFRFKLEHAFLIKLMK